LLGRRLLLPTNLLTTSGIEKCSYVDFGMISHIVLISHL
jgi:hypothetical protein